MTSALERTRDRGREHRAAGGGRGRSPRPRRTGCRTPRGLVRFRRSRTSGDISGLRDSPPTSDRTPLATSSDRGRSPVRSAVGCRAGPRLGHAHGPGRAPCGPIIESKAPHVIEKHERKEGAGKPRTPRRGSARSDSGLRARAQTTQTPKPQKITGSAPAPPPEPLNLAAGSRPSRRRVLG